MVRTLPFQIIKLRKKVSSLAMNKLSTSIVIKIQDRTHEKSYGGVPTIFNTAPLNHYSLIIVSANPLKVTL